MCAQRQPTTFDHSGRVVLIPGGLGALGQAVARAFAEAGATVVLAGSSEHPAELATLRASVGAAGERITFERADVTDEPQVEALIAAVIHQHQRLDVLVNVVGAWRAGQPITTLDLDVWDTMFATNLRTAFLLAKHAARPMTAQQWGRILHISSRGAHSGRSNAAAYAIAKNGVIGLAEVQAEELHGTNVTVNALLPSIFDTPANRAGMPNADFSRWPQPAEIARVLLFLASDDAALISGAAIPVYGDA